MEVHRERHGGLIPQPIEHSAQLGSARSVSGVEAASLEDDSVRRLCHGSCAFSRERSGANGGDNGTIRLELLLSIRRGRDWNLLLLPRTSARTAFSTESALVDNAGVAIDRAVVRGDLDSVLVIPELLEGDHVLVVSGRAS
jgi:hypothetical protein